MSASRLSRMDQLLSQNGSFHRNERLLNYRNNSSFESQLSFVKGYMDKLQSSSTYLNSNTKVDSNNYSNQGVPLTNRLPPSNKKSTYFTPQKGTRQVLSSSIYEKDSGDTHKHNLSCMNIKNVESDIYLRSELKDISSIKKKTTPLKERSIDLSNYPTDSNRIITRSETPCQQILKSIEKENYILKSELKDHTEEMRDINFRIKEIEKENKQLRHSLQKYYDKEEKEERVRQQESEGVQVLKQELLRSNTINIQLIQKIESMQKDAIELESEKEKFYKRSVILAKKIKNFQNVKVDLQEKLCNIEPELDKYQIKNELLEQDARHIQMELDFWRQKAEDQEFEFIKCKRTEEKLRIKVQEYEDIEAQDKEKQLSELNAIKQRNRHLENENREVKDQLKRVRTELGSNNFSEDSAQDAIANLKAKLHVETSRADTYCQRERELMKKIQSLEKLIKEVKGRNSDLEIQMTKIDAERKVEEDLEGCNYEKVVERQKNKVEDFSKDQDYLIEKLSRDLDMKENEIQSLKENFDSLYLQLIENQNMLKDEISLKNKVEQEKQQQVVELNTIKKEISKYKQNLESFKQNLTESQLKTSISKTNDCSEMNNNFGDKLRMLENTIVDVQNKKKQINQDNFLLKQRLSNLDSQLSS